MTTAKNEISSAFAWLGAYALFIGAAGFFWIYAFWMLIRQDRVLEAIGVTLVAPVGVVYGFLRFFGFL